MLTHARRAALAARIAELRREADELEAELRRDDHHRSATGVTLQGAASSGAYPYHAPSRADPDPRYSVTAERRQFGFSLTESLSMGSETGPHGALTPHFQLPEAERDPAPPGAGPLSGTLVVDLTHVLSGPHCTMMLGDLGARVVKVEQVERSGWGAPGPGLALGGWGAASKGWGSVPRCTPPPPRCQP